MANAIKVHSVDQEYWYIRTQRCKCGGELEVGNQALLSSQDLQFDVLDTDVSIVAMRPLINLTLQTLLQGPLLSSRWRKQQWEFLQKRYGVLQRFQWKRPLSLFSTLFKPKTNLLWITWKVLSSMQERNLKLPQIEKSVKAEGSGLNIQQVSFLNTDLWCHP